MSQFNRVELIAFLEWAAEKGLMKKQSAMSLKTACTNVLSILDDSEAADLSNIDWESVHQRWENINARNVSPSTMRAYRQRVKYGVEEFGRYLENRSTWKPAGGQRSVSSGSQSRKTDQTRQRTREVNEARDDSHDDIVDPSRITHRFPLRRDMVVAITGIPFDVKKSEMARLTAYLSNLVPSEEEATAYQLMLNPSLEEVNQP